MISTVLIVESNQWLGDHYQRSLEQEGFAVSRASNGYSAIDSIDNNPPEVIIMSLMLDGPGALGLLHELQSYTDTADIPIIVCMNTPNIETDTLEPYGVKRIIDSTTMKPADIPTAVRSVLA